MNGACFRIRHRYQHILRKASAWARVQRTGGFLIPGHYLIHDEVIHGPLLHHIAGA